MRTAADMGAAVAASYDHKGEEIMFPGGGIRFVDKIDAQPRLEQAEVIEDGQAVAVLLREADGTISAIRISVEQLAD